MPRGTNPISLANLRPFARGVSGNPGGRPRSIAKVEELAREHTEAAVATLAAIMTDGHAPASSRVAAASVLLDRGWGRARSEVTISDTPDVRSLSDLELDAVIVTELRQLLATADVESGDEQLK